MFDGGAGTYVLVGIGAFLVTVCSFGFLLPVAICMTYRWRCQHTIIYGRRLRFTGSALGLLGNWIRWFLLCIITLGIYTFWVVPRLTRWIVVHQDFEGAPVQLVPYPLAPPVPLASNPDSSG